jgi:hypothetical protein
MPEKLLRTTWTNLDSQELRLLLNKRIGGPGQFYNREANPNKFYLPPAARESCRVVLTLKNKQIIAVEPGAAFDRKQWRKICDEIENAVLVGPQVVGRQFSFCSLRVTGLWRGQRSGVQILPPPPEAPSASPDTTENPFILEFPFQGGLPDDLQSITNYRWRREHQRWTRVLNVLLNPRVGSLVSFRPESVWAYIPPPDDDLRSRNWLARQLIRFWRWCLSFSRSRRDRSGTYRWLQKRFSGPLDRIITDTLSPAEEEIEEIDSAMYYTDVFGNDGKPLRVPHDLDDSLCRYRDLTKEDKAKFDRATFWLDLASRQWNMSVSASFASLVSAIEALTDRGIRVYCEQCKKTHDVPGATEKFRSFLETYAPGAALEKRRNEMYEVRSSILHGSDLMQLDQNLASGFDPTDFNEYELQIELSNITRIALRNWLKNPPGS